MPFSMLDLGDIDEYMEFYRRIYPERKSPRERFSWQCLENPVLKRREDAYVLLFYKDRGIVGQSVLCPFEWHFRGKKRTDYMGVDWFVLEKHRGPIGTALAMKTIKDRPYYFGIGFSDEAERVWKRLGLRAIGNVEMFVWLRNPLKVIKLVAQRLGFSPGNSEVPVKMPERVMAKGMSFSLVRDAGHWEEHPWSDTLETSRPADFLRWRFFRSPVKRYYLYMSRDYGKPAYFVLRESFVRGFKFLVLVDYRIPERDEKAFDSVLKAAKRIAAAGGFDGIITASSHRFFDRRLRRALFMRMRKGPEVLTNAELDVPGEIIKNRELVYMTMADSDMDLVIF